MLPRCFPRNAAASPRRMFSTATSDKFIRSSVVYSSPTQDDSSVSSYSALQRQQLEFCCLLCGWDVACSTCPFNWFNFDPKKFRTKHRRRHGDINHLAPSDVVIQQAMKTLSISTTPTNRFNRVSVTQQQVKDAFRVEALKWHPDCNPDPEAETIFKDILAAYELLLAHAR